MKSEMRQLMNYSTRILKEKGFTQEEINKIIDENPYLTQSEYFDIPVFTKDSGKPLREIYNESKDTLFQDLYETGKKLRETLMEDMTDDEVREFINKSINEYRKEE